MILLFIIAIAVAFVCLIPRNHVVGVRGLTALRSEPMHLGPRQAMCGNCHGTGQEGLGLADWGECEACDGRGRFDIDQNAKTISLEEMLRASTVAEGEKKK